MKIKKTIFSFLIVFLSLINLVFSEECHNSAILYEVIFSLNDPNFSKNYDGNSGIIQKISLNSNNKYDLWQTPNLNSINNYPWGGASEIYKEYSNNENDFKLDSTFTSNKHNMLVLNSLGENDLDLYYNITLQNSGSCEYTNKAWIYNYNTKSITHYGYNDEDSFFLSTILNPSTTWQFENVMQDGLKSKVFHVDFNNLENYGRLRLSIGPENIYSNTEFQKVDAFFWLNGDSGYCGDSILHTIEECDDGNNIDGDGCSSICEVEKCVDNIRVDSVVFSLNDSTFSKNYDGNSGIIQRFDYNEETDEFSLWQSPNVKYITSWPWNPDNHDINLIGGYNNNDLMNPINLDANFQANKNKILIINKDGENSFNLFYNITLKNIGTCDYTNKARINRHYSYRILNYGSSQWNYVYPPYNNPRPYDWNPPNVEPNQTVSNVFNVVNSGMVNYGRVELRVGPHDQYKYSGEKHYQYFNTHFFINLSEPFCGNGIKEYGESCDLNDGVPSGQTCSNSCTLEDAIVPIIKWLNYENSSLFNRGNNIKIGENFILNYSAYNPSTKNITIQFDSMIYMRPFSSTSPWIQNRFYTSTLMRNDYDSKRIEITLKPGEELNFSRNVSIPIFLKSDYEVIYRLYFYERFRYKEEGWTSFTYPKLSNGNTNYGWWMTDEMKPYTTNSINGNFKYSIDLGSDYGLFNRGGALGFFNYTHSISELVPNNPSLKLTVSDEGIPEVEIYYHKGYPISSGIDTIPQNTYYLEGKLIDTDENKEIYIKNFTINRTFTRSDNNKIGPSISRRSEIEINEKINFPLYDFDLLNNKYVNFEVRPKLVGRDAIINNYRMKNTVVSEDTKLDLNRPIALSTDSPLILRPSGSLGYNKLYQRILIFNYLDYALFRTNLTVNFLDSGNNDVSSYYNFKIQNLSNLVIPAGSSYPIGVEIEYVGPGGIPNIENHFLNFCFNYFNPEENKFLDESLCKKSEIEVIFQENSKDFIDLIPRDLDFSLLNLNNETIANVYITNQGTKDANNFFVDLYVSPVNQDNFTHIGKKKILSLDSRSSTKVSFNFTPNVLGNYIIKAVIDEENLIFEDNEYVEGAESNNYLTTIAVVRDLDVFLESVVIDYENAENGLIPIKVFASNKGYGGIDSYEMKLNLYDNLNNFDYSLSHFFTQIPQEGIEKIYYLNVSDFEPSNYKLTIDLIAPFDPDLSDNSYTGFLSFCPLPWYDDEPDFCSNYCDSSCLNPFTGRYIATCNGVNSCNFGSEDLALACNGLLPGAVIQDPQDSNYELTCPYGNFRTQTRYTQDNIEIEGVNCDSIDIQTKPVLLNHLSTNMKLVFCIE